MIPKGSQRGGGQDLASHLLNEMANESVEVVEIRGAMADDLHGAFAEWHVLSESTKGTQYLYSVSINPWEDNYGRLSRDQYFDMIERLENKLNLNDQPRAVVFHEKDGREHCHVVWSRALVQGDKITLINMDYDRQKRRDVARDFCLDYDLPMPEGLEKDLGSDHAYKRRQYYDLYEKSVQDRTGLTKQDHMEIITDIWDRCDNAKAFKAAIEEAGYALTRGDKTRYVVVDAEGESFNLSKMIKYTNVKIKELCAFLEREDNHELKFIDQLKHAGSEIEARKTAAAAREAHMREEFIQKAAQIQAKFEKIQKDRRAKFDKDYMAMQTRHKKERKALLSSQRISSGLIRRARVSKEPAGMAALLYRITGLRKASRYFALLKLQKKRITFAEERQELDKRHQRTDEDYQRRENAMEQVEQKELASRDQALRKLLLEAGRKRTDTGAESLGAVRKAKNITVSIDDEHDQQGPDRGGRGR